MSPRELSPQTIVARLRVMSELLDVLGSLDEVTAEKLSAEPVTRLAVERILGQLVECAVDINTHVALASGQPAPADSRESFAAAARVGLLPEDLATELAPSTGMRNVLVHEYVAIDVVLVAGAAAVAPDQFGRYQREVARWISQQ